MHRCSAVLHQVSVSVAAVLLLGSFTVACQGGGCGGDGGGQGVPAAAKSPQAQETGVPAISFDKTTHDFGSIVEGESVTQVFRFKNTGSATLKLGKPSTSCGCTASRLTSDTIEPGGVGEVQATFNSVGREGHQDRSITMTTNIPDLPRVTLHMVGEVKLLLQFNPKYVNLRTQIVGKTDRRPMTVVNRSPSPITLVDVASSRPEELSCSLKKGTVLPPGVQKQFELTIKPASPERYFNADMLFDIRSGAKGEEEQRIHLTVFGQVASPGGEIPGAASEPSTTTYSPANPGVPQPVQTAPAAPANNQPAGAEP